MVESFLVENNRLGVRLAHRRHLLPTSSMNEDWAEGEVFLYADNLVMQRLVILR